MKAKAKTKNQRPKRHLFDFWLLVFGLISSPFSLLTAQGLLPPTVVSTATAQEGSQPLMIGDKVPESLILVDENATRRSLLSYKSALDLLVITFFSEPCDAGQALWPKFRRLNEDYKDWRVAFLAVSTEPGEVPARLPDILKHEKIFWPVLHDGRKTASGRFKITATPEMVIVDEFGILRYRGPISGGRAALDSMVGHTDSVKEPEPTTTGGCAL